jgi:two-component system response regulator HydG
MCRRRGAKYRRDRTPVQRERRLEVSEHNRVLIVDDTPEGRTGLVAALGGPGHVIATSDAFQALAKLTELRPAVVVAKSVLPGMSGATLMQRIHDVDPHCPVFLICDECNVENAVAAIRQGAAEYLCRPLDHPHLRHLIDRALEHRRVSADLDAATLELPGTARGLRLLVGTSPAMERVRALVSQLAPSRATVLLTGESGTGKERVAEAIHDSSPRAGQPFVRLHCAALAESLLESELFGHERGAFTGATGRREGRFKQADGGTLFLDEIGEISPAIQVKLLRFLQEREFERVGDNKTLRVDVRVIAATNRDLHDDVRSGRFRDDLLYRLDVLRIHVPPLRERVQDIPLLAAYFLQKATATEGRPLRRFSDEALAAMCAHPWPGNVRELENAVERAVVMARGDTIGLTDLPPLLVPPAADGPPLVPGASLAEVERFTILRTLEHTGGNKAEAARILGVTQRTIRNKLHLYAQAGHRIPVDTSERSGKADLGEDTWTEPEPEPERLRA